MIYTSGVHSIAGLPEKPWRVQLYWPTVRLQKADPTELHLVFDTIFRITSDKRMGGYYFGVGFVVLGFGVGFDYLRRPRSTPSGGDKP